MNDARRQVPTPGVRQRGLVSGLQPESAPSQKRRWALSLITIAIALVVGGAVGLAGGRAVASSSAADCTPTEQWCELGAALAGGAIGIAAGVVTYIVIGVVVIRRHRPKGRRAGLIAIHVVAPAVVVLLLGLLADVL